MTHGRPQEAEEIVEGIEGQVLAATGSALPPPTEPPIRLHRFRHVGFGTIAHVMFQRYFARSLLAPSLMAGQAFLYNAIVFTYALVLTTFYRVPPVSVGYYLIPFAIGNVLGPWLIGRFSTRWAGAR